MHARHRRVLSICLLLFALVVSQALGLVHGVAHVQGHAGTAAATAQDGAATASGEGEHWTAALFAGHAAAGADCALAGHGLAGAFLVAAPVLALASLPPLAAPPVFASAAPRPAGGAYFPARGPPSRG